MTELDFQFLVRPEPSAIISGFSLAGEVFLAILAGFARDVNVTALEDAPPRLRTVIRAAPAVAANWGGTTPTRPRGPLN